MSQQGNPAGDQVPQPIRDGAGATDPGSRNVLLDRQNPDLLTPPDTDAGTIPNLKFSFGMAHNRLERGGAGGGGAGWHARAALAS
jgi:oxalate decarboxylase